jgi:hypothetical protein
LLGAYPEELEDRGGGGTRGRSGGRGGDDAGERLQVGETELLRCLVTQSSAAIELLVEELVMEFLVKRLLHELSEGVTQSAMRRVINVEHSGNLLLA